MRQSKQGQARKRDCEETGIGDSAPTRESTTVAGIQYQALQEPVQSTIDSLNGLHFQMGRRRVHGHRNSDGREFQQACEQLTGGLCADKRRIFWGVHL